MMAEPDLPEFTNRRLKIGRAIIACYVDPGSPGKYNAAPEDCYPPSPAYADSVYVLLRSKSIYVKVDDALFSESEIIDTYLNSLEP